MQNNIGQNFGEGLNFAVCEQSISWLGAWSDCTSVVLCPGPGSAECEYTFTASSVVRSIQLQNNIIFEKFCAL